MWLIFGFKVQIGAAILIQNSPRSIANNWIFGFINIIEDVIQGLQFLLCESCLKEIGKLKSCLEEIKIEMFACFFVKKKITVNLRVSFWFYTAEYDEHN